MLSLDEILQGIRGLDEEQKNVVKAELLSRFPRHEGNFDTFLADERFGKDGCVCPHCGGDHIRRNGHTSDGRQRFLCISCGRTFGSRCRTVLAGTHKEIYVWERYLECMFEGYSLRRSAKECGISLTAAFSWRHKILDALSSCLKAVRLGGVVEADETYLDISYKGNHSRSTSFSMPRESRARGHQLHQSGISKELICVSCAISHDGRSAASAITLGRASETEMEAFFSGKLEGGTVLCTDHEPVYRAYAHKVGMRHIRLESHEVREGFQIERINAYHSRLKSFLSRFKGVSTKYLNNYLAWNTVRDMLSLRGQEEEAPLLREVLLARNDTTQRNMRERPPVPLCAVE
ncbi:MAG: IS1595 family transposase [Eubacterium sp.]|nr:IS1595 family transposase [Eubacterium sp.]